MLRTPLIFNTLIVTNHRIVMVLTDSFLKLFDNPYTKNRLSVEVCLSLTVVSCVSAEKQAMDQARLIQHQEDEHEADGEEDDDEEEEEEDGDQDDVWRRRRGSPEGRPEPKGHGFSDEALRKRVARSRAEEEEEEEDT